MDLIQKSVRLAPYTSWLVGGDAEYFSAPTNIDDVISSVSWGLAQHIPLTILGGGTNVLISEQGVRGLVICLRKLTGAESLVKEGQLHVTALAGTPKSELLKIFLKHKLAPAIFLAGLPGDVGGGVVMNAGVGESLAPREFVEIVDWVEVLPLPREPRFIKVEELKASICRFQNSDLTWSYRHCSGWSPGIILRVGLKWAHEELENILQKVKSANQIRLNKQPLSQPSCGSVFVNPPGMKAGAVIEQCGLRGLRVGGAQVSEKHANFIVNLGDARAADIHELITRVRAEVLAKTGVELKTEVVYLGQWS